MKTFKLILFCLLSVAFTACTDDEDPYFIESEIVGRSWSGVVGAADDCPEYLISTFYFGSDGFGDEIQYCPCCRHEYGPYRFQWFWDDPYSNNLVLDYGRGGVCYMDDLSVRGRHLHGVFVNEVDDCYEFTLHME